MEERTFQQGPTQRADDDSKLAYRAPVPAASKGGDAAVDHFTDHVAVANVCSMCPCGHCSIRHGAGLGGTNNAGVCDVKGCSCSGFSLRPGQGYGWQYEYAKE